jgi:hypothetical protein
VRKLLIVLLAIALVLFGALLPLVLPRHCPVTRAACDRIKEGMSQADVYAILGGPPGDYRTRPYLPRVSPDLVLSGEWESASIERMWEGVEGAAVVLYSADPERVVSIRFDEAKPYTPGLVELIRWRTWRLWKGWFH